MRVGWTLAVAALTVVVLGCTSTEAGSPTAVSPSPSTTDATATTSTTTRTGPPRPRELNLNGIDACSVLTEQQRAQLGLGGTPQPYNDSLLGSGCTVLDFPTDLSAAVVLATKMSLADWVAGTRSDKRQQIPVAGFSAYRATNPRLPQKCIVEVDVADGQFLSTAFNDRNSQPSVSQEQLCQGALRVAEAAMATLLASG